MSCDCRQLHSLPNRTIKWRRMRWAEHVARIGGYEMYIRGLDRKTWGKRPAGKPKQRWTDNMVLEEMGWKGVDWINLAHDMVQWRAVVNTVMNLWRNSSLFEELSTCQEGLLLGVISMSRDQVHYVSGNALSLPGSNFS